MPIDNSDKISLVSKNTNGYHYDDGDEEKGIGKHRLLQSNVMSKFGKGINYGSLNNNEELEEYERSHWCTPSFAVIAFITLIGDTARGCMFPTLWPYVQSLGGDKVHQGITVASFSLGRLLVSPYWGRMSEVHGYRYVLTITNIFMTVATLVYACAPNIYTLIFAQILLGIGSGTLGVTRAYVAEGAVKSMRTVLLAYLTAVQYAGFTVMPLAGGVMSEYLHGVNIHLFAGFYLNEFAAPAYFMGILAVISIILLQTVFRNRNKQSKIPKDKVNEDHNERKDYGLLGKWSKVDFIITGGFLLNIATKGSIACFETLGVQFGISHFNFTSADAGFFFASCGAFGVIALLNFKRLTDYINDIDLIIGGIFVMIFSVALLSHYALFDDVQSIQIWRFYTSIITIYAIGYPIGHTAVIGMFSKMSTTGKMLGYFGSAGSLARFAFPILAGFLAERYGDRLVFAVLAVFLSFTAIITIYFRDSMKELIAH